MEWEKKKDWNFHLKEMDCRFSICQNGLKSHPEIFVTSDALKKKSSKEKKKRTKKRSRNTEQTKLEIVQHILVNVVVLSYEI